MGMVYNKLVGKHSRKIMYVRYAEDWIIAVNRTYQETLNILKKDFCLSLGLTISEEKPK